MPPRLAVRPDALRLGWFHRYPARFAEPVVRRLLLDVYARLGRVPKLLLDPYAGSGTTLAAARQLGIPAVGVELGYLGFLISNVRLAPPEDVTAAVRWMEQLAATGHTAAPKHEHEAELARWMGEPNVRRLDFYLAKVGDVADERLRRFGELSLSGALRPASVWLPGSIKPQIDPSRVPTKLDEAVIRSARAIARDIRIEWVPGRPDATAIQGDAGALPFPEAAFDAVVTSPPYFTTYDYLDVQRLSYLAFGWNRPEAQQLGRRAGIALDGSGFAPPEALAGWYDLYRRERTSNGRALREYSQTLERHLRELARVTAPDAIVGIAVANSVRARRRFDLVGAVDELLTRSGFETLAISRRSVRGRRILPSGRDLQNGRFSASPTPGAIERFVWARRKRT